MILRTYAEVIAVVIVTALYSQPHGLHPDNEPETVCVWNVS